MAKESAFQGRKFSLPMLGTLATTSPCDVAVVVTAGFEVAVAVVAAGFDVVVVVVGEVDGEQETKINVLSSRTIEGMKNSRFIILFTPFYSR